MREPTMEDFQLMDKILFRFKRQKQIHNGI